MEEYNDGFSKLLDTVKKNKFSDEDIKKVTDAYQLAAKAHEGQKRRSGEPYIIHPVAVAQILAEMCMDVDSTILEDLSFTHNVLCNEFDRIDYHIIEIHRCFEYTSYCH